MANHKWLKLPSFCPQPITGRHSQGVPVSSLYQVVRRFNNMVGLRVPGTSMYTHSCINYHETPSEQLTLCHTHPRCNDQRVLCNWISYREHVRQEGHTYAHSHLTSANASLVTVLTHVHMYKNVIEARCSCRDPFQIAVIMVMKVQSSQ